jgi:hypothetical protein
VLDPERRRLLVFGTGEDLPDPAANATWGLTLDGTPSWTLLAPEGTAPVARYGAAAALDVANDRVAFFAGAHDISGSTGLRDHWLLQLSTETPTAIQVSLASSNATHERVTLSWWCARALSDARVERSSDAQTWTTLGAAETGGDGYVRWLDAGIEPGHRYAYRLLWREGSRENASAESWVEVPGLPEFTLHALAPSFRMLPTPSWRSSTSAGAGSNGTRSACWARDVTRFASAVSDRCRRGSTSYG